MRFVFGQEMQQLTRYTFCDGQSSQGTCTCHNLLQLKSGSILQWLQKISSFLFAIVVIICICMIMTLSLVEKLRKSPNDRFYIKYTVCSILVGKNLHHFDWKPHMKTLLERHRDI
jgi:hypothetical protein